MSLNRYSGLSVCTLRGVFGWKGVSAGPPLAALAALVGWCFAVPALGGPCTVADDGSGTVVLPPAGCPYLSPTEFHMIIDGLPAGTEIIIEAIHRGFICKQPGVPQEFCNSPGGSLGGEVEMFDSTLDLNMTGTGALAGFVRTIAVPIACRVDTGPRTPGDPVQTFPNDMFLLQGGIFGDPDFGQLNIVGGTGFGLPSPGQTTLTQQPGGDWTVDSFFDITYRIDFVGAPGGVLDGLAGGTTGTVHMQADSPVVPSCAPAPDGLSCQGTCPPPVPNPENATICLVADAGGTAVMPPECPGGYISPTDAHAIIDGLPAGATIQIDASHAKFLLLHSGPGGTLGGEFEQFSSVLLLNLTGTGPLTGFTRFLSIPVSSETHIGPRTPGDPVQSFATDMFMLQGELPLGDPDFSLLRVTAGTGFGLPSPGQTTLTQQASGQWAVDSFFDITYQIDFVGAPGSVLDGSAGVTTGTIRMQAGEPAGSQCTPRCVDFDPASGATTVTDCECRGPNDCRVDVVPLGSNPEPGPGSVPCVVADNGTGTVTLPPQGCDYLSPDEVHEILDGLPAGTTIELAAIHRDFICGAGVDIPVCSPAVPPGLCEAAGGSLGGHADCFGSTLVVQLTGTGSLAGFNRTLFIPAGTEVHTAPRTPGDAVQDFDTDVFRLQGQVFGDPDFDQLTITAGTDFGLPSPGHTTLTRLATGDYSVDSFFDITYRIDFTGAPGSVLDGLSGSTMATIRMQTGSAPTCIGSCPSGQSCTRTQTADPVTGLIHICCDCSAPAAMGACCTAAGCTVTTAADCQALVGDYKGDGTNCNDNDGDGIPDACVVPIPTVSAWGVLVLMLLLLTGGTVIFARRGRWVRE